MKETKTLIIVGDGACGKTSLLIVHSTGTFPTVYIPTAFDYHETTIVVDGRAVSVGVCDAAGQSGYDRLRPLCYTGAHCFWICFAVDDGESLRNVKEKWIPEITHHCPDLPIILVACKIDLRSDHTTEKSGKNNILSASEGQRMAKDIGAFEYLECSALTNTGVREVFESAARASLMTSKPVDRKPRKKCILL